MSDSADVVWLDGPGKLAIRSEPLSAPASGELRCETIVSAISPGTELAAWRGLPPLRPGKVYPRLQGYCNVARVVAVGSDVTGFHVGDRVVSFSSHRSAFNLAASDALVTLALEADAGRAATAYLFHLGYNAILLGGVRAGSRVTVIGMGALGLTSVAMAALAGAEVTAITGHAAAAAMARRLGAHAVLSRAEAGFADDNADVIIATTNGWDDWALALRRAATRGTIAVLGFPGRGEPAPTANPLDSQYFYMKQLRIEAVGASPEQRDARGFARFNERDNLRFITSRIADSSLDADALISGRFPGRAIGDAYAALDARTGDPVTFLLDWAA